MRRIITIGREFSSGGRELGKRLAEELQIAYYDKEVVDAIVKHSNLAEEYVNQVLEKNIVNYFPITISHSFSLVDYPSFEMEGKVYEAQREAINELAKKSDCVIVGRCADYLLEELNPYRIFVYSNMDARVKRCIKKGEHGEITDERQIIKKIKKIDRERKNYYEFYTGQRWGDKVNYDLMVNTANIDIKSEIPAIATMAKAFFKE